MSQTTNLVYNVKDKPGFGKVIVFALQQLLAILAATVAVPAIIGHGMSPAAALLGAGVGTLVYLLFTKFRSPVFLGSSFAFLGSMGAAFAGAVSMGNEKLGYFGLLIGAVAAGLVYVLIALLVKFVGARWISKIMPAVVIGPTVAIIGLSLAGNAVGDLTSGAFATTNTYLAFCIGLVTLITTIVASVYFKGFLKMIPFVLGIVAGYAVASLFTVIGIAANNDALKVIDFSKFQNIEWIPSFTFIQGFGALKEIPDAGEFMGYIGSVVVAYVPVAAVVFAEHIADHKNLSSIIGTDLLEDPGLHRTLLGDGVGSIAGAFFGGCPNTTYGESIGTVAISGNASTITILVTALAAIVLAFVGPFATFLETIPSCVMGGVCIALYGFIAVSGLKMLQPVDLGDNRNLFVASVILITGIGGLSLTFGKVTITPVACALILGIIVNCIVGFNRNRKAELEAAAKANKEEK